MPKRSRRQLWKRLEKEQVDRGLTFAVRSLDSTEARRDSFIDDKRAQAALGRFQFGRGRMAPTLRLPGSNPPDPAPEAE